MFIIFQLVKMFLFIMSLGVVSAMQWPKQIQRCLRSEPQMDQCLLAAAKVAIPRIAKGISEIGLEPLDPLTDANFTLGNEGGPVSLRVKADHVTISGPSKMQLQKIKYNENLSRLEITARHKLLKMNGNYNAFGHILVVPINTRGFFTFEFKDVHAFHTVNLRKNTGEKFKDKSLTFKVNNLARVIVNLKDQNNAPSHSLNRLVNDNWKLVSRAMIPSMERSIQRIYSEALSPIFSSFTIKDILPDTLRSTLDT